MQDLVDTLRWDDLRFLLAVVRAGSFSAAAQALTVEQSTVSRRIAALEGVLGTALFERSHTGLRATEATEALLPHLERVEAELRAVLDAARQHEPEVRGRVRLALTEALAAHYVIPRLLRPLRAQHPRLTVDLLTSDLAADLSRREADLALRFFRPRGGDLIVKRVARLPTTFVAHQSYPKLASKVPAEHDFIALALPGIDTPEEAFARRHAQVEPSMRTNGYLAQVEAVRAGLGVALLARSVLQLDPELVELDLGLPAGPTLELFLVCPRGLRQVPRVDAVFRALEEHLPQLERAARPATPTPRSRGQARSPR
ncbi:MAG: LysR family transcriptional regulator [Myxococcales bacterium]|nr:LysR family transcriptional regulator [Myxococcales bacterium]